MPQRYAEQHRFPSIQFYVDDFIRRSEVYKKMEKYSRTYGNPIVIHYAFQLPEQNGMPAIEVFARPTAMTA